MSEISDRTFNTLLIGASKKVLDHRAIHAMFAMIIHVAAFQGVSLACGCI